MIMNIKSRHRRNRNRTRMMIWAGAALIFLAPLVSMQVTDQVAWDGLDFAIFGALLAGACATYDLATSKSGNAAYRLAVGVALVTAFFLVWVNGGVGIIGAESETANMMYGGVLAVGLIVATITRFSPHGMSLAFFATAFAQVLVAVVALIGKFGSTGPKWPLDVLGLTAVFTGLWLTSALLFRKAAREQKPAGAETELPS